MFWLVLILMGFAAAAFVAWPLLRGETARPVPGVATIVAILAISVAVYAVIGSPDTPSGRGQPAQDEQLPDVEAMVASLAERLKRQPEDLAGWQMLGRSYMTLGRYDEAVSAYRKAVELESAGNPDTLVALGEAQLASNGQQLTPAVVSLFENALALDPSQPAALFWGGIASANQGQVEQAADRWERLLTTNPPPEIRQVIAQRIAEWRGEPMPEAMPVAPSAPAGRAGAIISASIALSESASTAVNGDATVFVIARDPAQPSPPIAVARRRVSELPAVVQLGDGDSMIPGRTLSGFDEFELVARVSASGQPIAQSGDWFGSTLVRPADDSDVDLAIDSQVP